MHFIREEPLSGSVNKPLLLLWSLLFLILLLLLLLGIDVLPRYLWKLKTAVSCNSFFLIVLKISLPSLDIPLKLLSFNTVYEKVQHVLDLHTCRIEILILILLNNQDKTSSSWNYIPIAARINDIWHVNR